VFKVVIPLTRSFTGIYLTDRSFCGKIEGNKKRHPTTNLNAFFDILMLLKKIHLP
jgi:hypothetical protein